MFAFYRHTNGEGGSLKELLLVNTGAICRLRRTAVFPTQIWIVRHFFEGDRVITKYEASEIRRNL